MRRIRTAGGHVEFAGRPVECAGGPDGVEVGPSGEELRQVVQEQRIPWECTTWCSQDGVVYDRCFDPFRGTFVWSAPRAVGADPVTGHFTTVVGRDSDLRRTVRLVRAIAMAWVEPPRTQVKLQACALPGREPVARNLVWVRTGVRSFEDDGAQDEPLPLPPTHDTWRPLRYTWRSICGDVTHRLDESSKAPDERYEVSARGWLRSPHGTNTKGVRSTGGRLYACVAGVGAIWMDEAVLCTFSPDAAPPDGTVAQPVHANGHGGDNGLANLSWAAFVMAQVRHDATLEQLGAGGTLDDMCASGGIRRTTAWDRIAAATWELPLGRVRAVAAALAPPFVRDTLRQKMEAGELDAADTVTHCVEACDAALAEHDTWSRLDLHDRFGVVKVGRALVLRDAAQAAQALAH